MFQGAGERARRVPIIYYKPTNIALLYVCIDNPTYVSALPEPSSGVYSCCVH
jgi:hypothetical protein